MIALNNTFLPLVGLLLALFFHRVLAERGDACGKYACGSATWTWVDGFNIKDISVSVKDTDCDAKYVYVYLKYRYVILGKIYDSNTLRFENHSGCKGGYKTKGTKLSKFAWKVRNIRVFVCRSDKLRDTCYASDYN